MNPCAHIPNHVLQLTYNQEAIFKGRWVLNGYFFQLAHFSSGYETHNIHYTIQDDLQIENRGCSHFRHKFQRSHDYLIHYQSEDFCAH